MKLHDVSDRNEEHPYSVADAKVPSLSRTKPIETDALVSGIVGYKIKGDDKRLIQFVVALKREYGPEASAQYLINTNKEVQDKLKVAFS